MVAESYSSLTGGKGEGLLKDLFPNLFDISSETDAISLPGTQK
jgi:hypothetical protein